MSLVRLGGAAGRPVMVVGPSLGTSVVELWSASVSWLAEDFQVFGWDLPGHGQHRPTQPSAITISSLAADVRGAVERVVPGPFHYAGVSVGGAVGLQLALDAPSLVVSASLVCTGARIGTPGGWLERADLVRAHGTRAVVAGSRDRWFAPSTSLTGPDRVERLLASLLDVDEEGYAAVCEALAGFDLRDRLAEVAPPVLAVAGEHDVATPPDTLAEVARGVRSGRLVVMPDVAHLAPFEAPRRLADLVRQHARTAVEATGSAGVGRRGPGAQGPQAVVSHG